LVKKEVVLQENHQIAFSKFRAPESAMTDLFVNADIKPQAVVCP
jgi:hypothetical protein